MSEVGAEALEDASRRAEELAARVRELGEDAALADLDRALADYRAEGYPLDAVLPASSEADISFSLRRARDGKSFWSVYAEVLREDLCAPDGQLRKLALRGLNTSAGAILAVLVGGLGLPGVVLGLLVPIAALIAAKGIDAFCRFTTDP
jgi:hypothetical protein